MPEEDQMTESGQAKDVGFRHSWHNVYQGNRETVFNLIFRRFITWKLRTNEF